MNEKQASTLDTLAEMLVEYKKTIDHAHEQIRTQQDLIASQSFKIEEQRKTIKELQERDK